MESSLFGRCPHQFSKQRLLNRGPTRQFQTIPGWLRRTLTHGSFPWHEEASAYPKPIDPGDRACTACPGAAIYGLVLLLGARAAEGSLRRIGRALLRQARIPKCRRKVLFEKLREVSWAGVPQAGRAEGARVVEWHVMLDHVHMTLSVPPKLSISHVVGYIKGKSAIHIARTYEGKQRNYAGHQFWARGYFLSTVNRDEKMIREYIRKHEKEDKPLDQLLLTK